MSAPLTEQEMERRETVARRLRMMSVEDLCEAHAALRAEREESERLRSEQTWVACQDCGNRIKPGQEHPATNHPDAVPVCWGCGPGGGWQSRAVAAEKEREADRRLLERCREWLKRPRTWLDRMEAYEAGQPPLLRDLDARLGEGESDA